MVVDSDIDKALCIHERDMRVYKKIIDVKKIVNDASDSAGLNNKQEGEIYGIVENILELDQEYCEKYRELMILHDYCEIEAKVHLGIVAERLIIGEKFKGSNGERIIDKELQKSGVKYQREAVFDDLRHVGKLRFDFYLDEYNAAIEFQGQQHFEPIECFGGEDGFKSLQVRDEIKKQWCINKGVRLFLIEHGVDDATREVRKILNTLGVKRG